MNTLSHQSVLERGFVLVSDASGTLVRQAAEVSPGASLLLRFADGGVGATATSGAPRVRKASEKPKDPGRQGQLF
jgi:exodeoxyribonuclease VII large subunit